MREKYDNTVKVQMSAETMREIINYIYTGKILIKRESVFDLLSTAHYLMLNGELKTRCHLSATFYLLLNINLYFRMLLSHAYVVI